MIFIHKRSWKILYTNYKGLEKKAVEFLSAEIGKFINRDNGVYTLHVLPCEMVGNSAEENAVIIGTYDECDQIRALVSRDEVPENGYLICSMDNPQNPTYTYVIITAFGAQELFYGAVDFVDDCLMSLAPVSGGLRTPCEVFNHKLPVFKYNSVPTAMTRSVFTWGHSINDYRAYIANLARLKINQLIIWNDYMPLNAKDIVQYAHEYGIQLNWGFAWGWSTNCRKIDLKHLDDLRNQIVQTFLKDYDQRGDGIYFQSFTEMEEDRIGDMLVAEAVARFVNDVSSELLEIRPDLHIQFGLHATSVRNHMSYIGMVDSRVEIVWEDCGAFPYHYLPVMIDEQDFQDALDFTEKIITLRAIGNNSFVFKGMMTMDWSKFVHQSGPYIMGIASMDQIKSDVEMLSPIWKSFQSEWMQNGKYVHSMSRYITQRTGGNVNLNIAGALDGGIWFPEALCAQIMWNCNEDYDKILEKVSKRLCVRMV